MAQAELTVLRRRVREPCELALLDSRPRFGLILDRELAGAGGLLTSDATITPGGQQSLAAFRGEWTQFAATVSQVLGQGMTERVSAGAKGRPR